MKTKVHIILSGILCLCMSTLWSMDDEGATTEVNASSSSMHAISPLVEAVPSTDDSIYDVNTVDTQEMLQLKKIQPSSASKGFWLSTQIAKLAGWISKKTGTIGSAYLKSEETKQLYDTGKNTIVRKITTTKV